MTSPKSNRRQFLSKAVKGTAILSTLAWSSFARGDSPMNQLRIGVIGTGVRGKYLIGNLPPSVRVVAISDCAESRMAETITPTNDFAEVLEPFKNRDARRCRKYQDYRQMLDREKLDAVIIATPDHHHSLAAILALDAGLDVYLEKPMTVTIGEGRLIVDKVKKTGRILQVGSQQRTMALNRFACDFIRDGGLGKIRKIAVPNYPGPIIDPLFKEEPVSDGLDWGLFLGPTPLRPHNRHLWVKDDFRVNKLLWRGWDLFRDFSGHLMTNWAAHSVDMIQYALGCDDSGPVSVRAYRPESTNDIWKQWDHKTPAPTSQDDRRFWPVEMQYASGTKVNFSGGNNTMLFHGELGTMKLRRNFFEVDPPELIKDGPDLNLAAKWDGVGNVARPHLENWLDCISTRAQPNAPVEVGHRTSTACHLANLAREFDRTLRWNAELEQFVEDEAANTKLNRPRRRGFELPA